MTGAPRRDDRVHAASPGRRRPRLRRRLLGSLLAGILPGLVLPRDVTVTLARPLAGGTAPDWAATGLTDPALGLFAAAGGVLYVPTAAGLRRSDDAGATWQPVPLGPATDLLAVDPGRPATLYAAGPGGVYTTADDGGSWAQTLAYGPEAGGAALALAVSPADPVRLYLGVTGDPGASIFRFLRSRDGGAAWEPLEALRATLCRWGVPILQGHPTDPRRVFRVAACAAGRVFGERLEQSPDAGESWAPFFTPPLLEPTAPFLDGYPEHLVGGDGPAPQRFYLAVNRDQRVGGSSVVRSDDDGATWSEVLAYRGGGSSGPGGATPPGEDPSAPNVRLGGLVYDPARPDRVYVGRQVFRGRTAFAPAVGGAVAASPDGGQTWADLGRQDLGAVRGLALGGGWLFAATDRGLWRLWLGAGVG